jgi:uncharacterized membrane protein
MWYEGPVSDQSSAEQSPPPDESSGAEETVEPTPEAEEPAADSTSEAAPVSKPVADAGAAKTQSEAQAPAASQAQGGSQELADPGAETLALFLRGLALLMGIGASIGLFLWQRSLGDALLNFVRSNTLGGPERRAVLKYVGVGVVIPLLLALVYLLPRRKNLLAATQAMESMAWRLSPLTLVAVIPLMFRWELWKGADMQFLVLALFTSWTSQKLFFRSLTAPVPLGARAAALRDKVLAFGERHQRRIPWAVVLSGFAFYAAYFSFYTVQNHHNLRTASYDLGIEDNIVYNCLRGHMMKASPVFGPEGSHIGHHATLFAFVLAPFYAISQRAETLLIIQSVLIGAAVIPLFLFAKNRIGPWRGALLASLFVFYAPIHGANFYDFHYPPLGIGFVFWSVFLVDTKRYRWAVLTVLLALSVREDIALCIFAAGAYFVLTKTNPKAGAVMALAGFSYFITMKMVLMPIFRGGEESFIHVYKDLRPATGFKGFTGVLATVLSNPGFTLSTLLTSKKTIYVLQVMSPFVFLPLRRPVGFLFAVPGVLMTLLSSRYASTSISFQYTSHWAISMFLGSVVVLTDEQRPRFAGDLFGKQRVSSWLFAITVGMMCNSYQHGGIFQHNTAQGGFWKFQFERKPADIARYNDLHTLIAQIPPKAIVAASEFTLPQISNRPNAYTLRTVGVKNAEYILFPRALTAKELPKVRPLLENKKFGVVAEAGEFVLAKRGHSTEKNEALLKRMGKSPKKDKKKPAPAPVAPSATPKSPTAAPLTDGEVPSDEQADGIPSSPSE